eukprot:scaffold14380_cov94-Skeletonema_dohrnii-CCMP3373.AAC.1
MMDYASIWCKYQVMQYPKGSTLNARKRRVCFRYDGGKVLVKLFSFGGCKIQVKTETKGAFEWSKGLNYLMYQKRFILEPELSRVLLEGVEVLLNEYKISKYPETRKSAPCVNKNPSPAAAFKPNPKIITMMKPALHLISLLFTISPIIVSSSANNDAAEATRYSTLPPTVFAPGGRLFGVERVAREAIGQQPSTTTEDDSAESCCTVFAVRCGVRQYNHDNEEDDRGELTIMVGIGPISPSLYRDVELYQQSKTDEHIISKQESHDNDDADEQQISTNTVPFYKPLLAPEQHSLSSPLPISILSPTLITATGGTSIDSSILLRRSIE